MPFGIPLSFATSLKKEGNILPSLEFRLVLGISDFFSSRGAKGFCRQEWLQGSGKSEDIRRYSETCELASCFLE